MATLSKIIFTDGKELAMQRLFDNSYTEAETFPYLALGYSNGGGFVDSQDTPDNGFIEIDESTYERIELHYKDTEKDDSTGKVTVTFSAELDYSNITETRPINQIAVVNSGVAHDGQTKFYSATTFPTFQKHAQNAMTFVIGFRF